MAENNMKKQEELLATPEGKLQAEKAFAGEPVSNAFAKALVGFLPAVVGAAFGGDTGGAIGAQAGGQAVRQYTQAEAAEFARQDRIAAQQRQNQFDMAIDAKKREGRQQELEAAQKFQTRERIAEQQFKLERDKKLQDFALDKIGKKQAAATDLKLTETQAKARKFADSAELAENQYQNALKETGFSPGGALDTLQTVSSMVAPKQLESLFQSEGFERARNAERTFINASLRDDSGAVLKDDEIEEAATRLFPRPGDSENTIKQKEQSRALIIQNLKEKGKILNASEARQLIDKQLEVSKSGLPNKINEEVVVKRINNMSLKQKQNRMQELLNKMNRK